MESAREFIDKWIATPPFHVAANSIEQLVKMVTSRDLAIQQDEAARCAERAVEYLKMCRYKDFDGEAEITEQGLHLAITQGQPEGEQG